MSIEFGIKDIVRVAVATLVVIGIVRVAATALVVIFIAKADIEGDGVVPTVVDVAKACVLELVAYWACVDCSVCIFNGRPQR